MSIDASQELACAKELLKRSVEVWNKGKSMAIGSIEERLERAKYLLLVKATTLMEYLDPVQQHTFRSFKTERDLRSVFTGTEFRNVSYGGLQEGQFRNEKMYPSPDHEPHFITNVGVSERDFGLPLLAKSGWAWTGWHVDQNPVGDVAGQLQMESKLWFFESTTRQTRMLRTCNKKEWRGVPRSLPSTFLKDLKRNHGIRFCVQEAGDVVYFQAKVCLCVLSRPTSMLTVTV